MTKLIFGCGYLGSRVAQRWRDARHEVVVVTRSRARAEQFHSDGYTSIVADITQPSSLQNLPTADTVLFAIGYDRQSPTGATIEQVYAGGLRNALAALPRDTGRLIYISTTGVYGPAGGDWVDEATPPAPEREGGRASLAAEQVLAAHPLGTRSIILRLAGIYGPDRIPFINELRGGKPIPAITSGYLNLIHVDDAASVVAAAAKSDLREHGPRIYCVSDGHPVQRGEYYSEVAKQIGAAPPRFVDPEPNSPRAVRAASSRRVRNDCMLAELRVTLAFPTHRAALAQILSM